MGVPMNYGKCDGGPWHNKDLAHHEQVYVVPIDRHTKKPAPGMQRTPATETGYLFGEYRWESSHWVWSAPETAVDKKTRR